jgi:Co/Zn/Cd efflux system component
MATTGQQPAKVVHHDRPTKHVHHGRTLAAWTGTTIGMVAFIVGGIAVVIQNWTLFWICAALLVVALIATKVLQVMGHGAR